MSDRDRTPRTITRAPQSLYEPHGQSAEQLDRYVRQMGSRLADQLHAFIGREQGLLVDVLTHAHDQLVDEAAAALDDVEVAQ